MSQQGTGHDAVRRRRVTDGARPTAVLPTSLDHDELLEDACVLTDHRGRVTAWSGRMEQLLGFLAPELEGEVLPLSLFQADQLRRRAEIAGVEPGLGLLLMSPSTFERRRDRQVDLGALDRRGRTEAADGSAPACDWTLVHRDGHEVIASITVTPIGGPEGSLTGYGARCVDVTQERRTHSLLVKALIQEREAAQRLAELDRERDVFVATASHELRTPVASILGYAELLQDLGPRLDPEVQGFVAAIKRNADRLKYLSEDLLSLARSSAGQRGTPVAVDLGAVVDAAWDGVTASSRGRRLELTRTLPGSPVTVTGEPDKLERVVLNLVGNAIKFTPDGGRVHCVLDVVDDRARLRVSDTGVGVRAEDQAQLFSRFFRGAAAHDGQVKGTGLGLSIVRAIVEEHGGEISLESEVGRGTTVTVHLPL